MKIKALCLFDFNTFTGFATVSRNLVQQWQKFYGKDLILHIVAVNYFGDEYKVGDNIHVIPAKKKDIAKDDFGRYVFMASLRDGDYDLVFILQDLGVIVPTIPHIKEIKQEKIDAKKKVFKSVLYFPVDFALTPNLGVGLEFFDMLATYTEYGRTHVLNINKKIACKVIPHGSNLQHFHPIEEPLKKQFREEYFGANAGKFIVGCVNRNQSRKDIPTTIFGFMEYKDTYNKDAFLYLHMNPKDPMGWHLRTILAQTNLVEGKDFMFPPEEDYSKGADIAKLNAIYNSLDVFLSTATGGGWELTVTEAMSTRTPVVIPKHTSFQELAGKNGQRAFLLENQYPTVAMIDNIIRYQSDIFEIAEQLDKVHRGEGVKEKVEEAFKFVHSEELKWENIARTFAENFNRLLKR